jgi:hypothetical protein
MGGSWTNLRKPAAAVSIRRSCPICLRAVPIGRKKLCARCARVWTYDSQIEGYRKKKRIRKEYKKFDKRWKGQDRLERALKALVGGRNIFREARFNWSPSPTGSLLEYDFYIPVYGLLVEFNGEEHFAFSPWFHCRRSDFDKQQLHDELKKKYAKEKGLRLVIFTEDDDLTIENVALRLKSPGHRLG